MIFRLWNYSDAFQSRWNVVLEGEDLDVFEMSLMSFQCWTALNCLVVCCFLDRHDLN